MNRKNKGFVLVEMLAAVAILIISFGIVGVNATEIKKELAQMEADAIARSIFVAAQDQITRAYTSGNNKLLSDQREFEYDPETYTGTDRLRYVYSTDAAAESLCCGEWEGSWVVEYDARFGHVYGVFYSTNKLDPYTTTDFDEQWRHSSKDLFYDFADENRYNVAYYGGEVMDATVPEPIKPKNIGFCYYEVYENDNNILTSDIGYYIFDKNIDTLQNRLVIGDGYGVMLEDTSNISNIKISGTKSITLGSCQFLLVSDGTGSVIMRLPSEWMCANWLFNSDITKSTPTRQSLFNQDYWWDITIDYGNTSESWKYCPYYAKTAVSYTKSKNLPKEVYIRSARQLNALSWMYPSYFNKKWAWDWTEEKVSNTTFIQELDIDYNKYQFNAYTGRDFVGQLPIGTDWGRFISNYDGGGNKILNCKFLRRNTTGNEYSYAGLFGFVSNGTIKNVNIDGTVNNLIENADYCGVFAAYIQNERVYNCNVNNYTIDYAKSSAAPSGTSSPNEFKYARIGLFAGYVKAPSINEPGSTIIDDCSVTNSTLKANNYLSTESDSRATNRCYNIGGFIGSIADREQSKQYGTQVSIIDCSVQATISTKSYGKMAWFNIGGFAGAKGWPSVSNCTTNVSGLTKNHYELYYISYGN